MNIISSKFIAVFIFTATALWIGSGFVPGLASADNGSEASESSGMIVPSVLVKSSRAQEIAKEITLYGTTESIRKVVVKSETIGRIVAIKAIEGEPIEEGDVIVVLDLKDRQARLAQARAFLKQRQLEYDVAKALKTSGHQSKTKLSEALANLKTAEADLKRVEIEVQDTKIRSPFSGVVQEIRHEEGDFIDKEGVEVATIIDQVNFLAVGQVPEKMVGSLEVGNVAHINTVTGIDTQGVIRYISKVADPVTRTFRVEIEAANNNYNLQEGVTTEIRIPTKSVLAHKIKSSVFALDENGDIGVKILGPGDIVKFYPVNIIKEEDGGVWVSGLPAMVNIITLGQAFLKDGDVAQVAE